MVSVTTLANLSSIGNMFVLGLLLASFISTAVADNSTYGNCVGPVLLNSTTLQLGPNEFLYEKYSCLLPANTTDTSNSTDSADSVVSALPVSNQTSTSGTNTSSDATSPSPSLKRRGFFDLWPLCIFFHTCRPIFFAPYYPPPPPPPRTPPPPKDVCGSPCRTSCNDNVGQLPPVTDDCQTIQNSIQILNAQLATTFTVESGHQETLSFGTCTVFFENLGRVELNYCWNDLSNNSAIAGAACFPPVHPPFSEGLCTSYDGTWSVGVAHS